MASELNIWCANIGWKWHDNWVHRLARMVEENCSVPYRFRCISDHEIEGIETVPFSRDIEITEAHHSQTRDSSKMILNEGKPQGCWGKVDVWKYAELGSWNILLDLDVCVVGDLARIVSTVPAGARDCRHTEGRPWLNGSVISWRQTEETQKVYPDEIPYREYPRGEQEYVQKALGGFIPLMEVESYKCQLSGSNRHHIPERLVVVYFHGNPTPAHPELQQYAFVGRTWKGIERIDRV